MAFHTGNQRCPDQTLLASILKNMTAASASLAKSGRTAIAIHGLSARIGLRRTFGGLAGDVNTAETRYRSTGEPMRVFAERDAGRLRRDCARKVAPAPH